MASKVGVDGHVAWRHVIDHSRFTGLADRDRRIAHALMTVDGDAGALTVQYKHTDIEAAIRKLTDHKLIWRDPAGTYHRVIRRTTFAAYAAIRRERTAVPNGKINNIDRDTDDAA